MTYLIPMWISILFLAHRMGTLDRKIEALNEKIKEYERSKK